jgi:hypothetical protein
MRTAKVCPSCRDLAPSLRRQGQQYSPAATGDEKSIMAMVPNRDTSDSNFIIALSSLVTAAGISMVGYEFVMWLRDGYWTPILVGNYISKSQTYDWSQARVVEKIFDELRSLDAGPLILAVGGIYLSASLIKRLHMMNASNDE